MRNDNSKFKIVSTFTVVILGVIGFAKTSLAATYYIDYSNGLDINNGTSTATPWKHVPGDSSFAGTYNFDSTNGDTFIFKGGIVYSGTGNGTLITVNKSGLGSGKEIIYRGNTVAGDWGIGKAAIDLATNYYRAFYASSKNYINIIGFDIYNAKNDDTGSTGVIDATTATNWLVKDSKFHEVQSWSSVCAQGSDSGVPATTQQIRFRPSSSNLEVANNEFYAFGETGIDLYGVNGINIHDNDFGGADQIDKKGYFSVAIRIEGSSYNDDNVTIKNNIFHDGWQYEGDDPVQKCHAGDWIHAYGTSGNPLGTLIYEGNFFYNDKAFTYTHGSAFSRNESYINNLIVRNNVFVNPHAGHGGIDTDTVTNVYFYNNTTVIYPITNNAPAGHSLQLFTNLWNKNNICINFAGSNSYCNYDSSSAVPTESDYNIYYTPNGATAWRYGSNYYSLAQWKTASAKEIHSVSTNPNLIFLPATGMTSSAGDYRLSATSLNAVDMGATITDFSIDKNNAIRPIGSAWDIGAYEFVGSAPPPDTTPPSPPTGVAVQ